MYFTMDPDFSLGTPPVVYRVHFWNFFTGGLGSLGTPPWQKQAAGNLCDLSLDGSLELGVMVDFMESGCWSCLSNRVLKGCQ